MADTNTPNILLLLPDLGDTFNFSLHVENNFSTIDSLMGMVQCTTTTRPSNTYAGQGVYETDSKRYAQNTGSKATPTWTYMSHAALAVTAATHPTSGLSIGELIYETDSTRFQIYNGTSWEQKAYSNFVCTSSAHPASPFTGLEIIETDTGLNAVYSGAAYTYAVSQAAPTQALVATTASVTFTGIPAVNHLALLWQARTTSANLSDNLLLRLNSDTGSNYGSQDAQGQGSTASAVTTNVNSGTSIFAGVCAGGGATAGYYGGGHIDILGWGRSASGHQATVVGTSQVAAGTSSGQQIAGVFGGAYNPSATLTSITLLPAAGSFASGSTMSLYSFE